MRGKSAESVSKTAESVQKSAESVQKTAESVQSKTADFRPSTCGNVPISRLRKEYIVHSKRRMCALLAQAHAPRVTEVNRGGDATSSPTGKTGALERPRYPKENGMKNIATLQAWERYSAAIESADASRADAAEAARLALERELLGRAVEEARRMVSRAESGDYQAAASSLQALRSIATEHAAVVAMPAGTRKGTGPSNWEAVVRGIAMEACMPSAGVRCTVAECQGCGYPHVFIPDGEESARCPSCGSAVRA